MKTCSKCKEIKFLIAFSKDKHTKSGYCSVCKDCRKKIAHEKALYFKEYREKHSKKNIEYQKRYRKENKELLKQKVLMSMTDEKLQRKSVYNKAYRELNKEKIQKIKRAYYEKNKEKFEVYFKNYRQINKERLNKLQNSYINTRKKQDPLFKLRIDVSSLVNKSLKSKGYNKNTKTFNLLGCDYETLVKHLESQFKEGMSWKNRGNNGWHIDHIYPNALCKTEEELIKNQHYTNLQPLWAKENLIKGCKIV